MPVAAIVGAVGAVASAGIGAYASSKAASAQKSAAKKASKTQTAMYEQGRADRQPYFELGGQGMKSLAGLYGIGSDAPFSQQQWEAFQKTPFYEAPYQEGIRALDSSAAARGNLLSSGQMRRVQQFGSDYASGQFGNYMDRLRQLAGIGANAASGNASDAMQTGSNVASNQLAAGQAQASGYVGMANNAMQGINNLAYAAQKMPSGYQPASIY